LQPTEWIGRAKAGDCAGLLMRISHAIFVADDLGRLER